MDPDLPDAGIAKVNQVSTMNCSARTSLQRVDVLALEDGDCQTKNSGPRKL
jgi:hypothetical protein